MLDFGLAKLAPTAAFLDASATGSPTITADATREGFLLGTAAYMSPEQARGEAVDKRTGVWAFGCVLYGMLAGRAAFARETITDTLAAILERERTGVRCRQRRRLLWVACSTAAWAWIRASARATW